MGSHGQGWAPPVGGPQAAAEGRLCPLGLPSGSSSVRYLVLVKKFHKNQYGRSTSSAYLHLDLSVDQPALSLDQHIIFFP